MTRLRTAALALALVAAPLAAFAAGPYDANCKMCHQTNGAGLANQFPRLSGRAADMARTPEGRSYLVEVALYGMTGRIDVDDKPLSGVMPGFARLDDATLAAILNQVTGFGGGKAKAFTPAEVKAGRATKLTTAQVRARREALFSKVRPQ